MLLHKSHLKSLSCLFLCVSFMAHAAAQGSIARAQFTTHIENREPVDQVVMLSNTTTNLSFFTDIRNMDGKTIVHSWRYQGKTISTKEFKIDGPRWRVYSEKDLDPSMTGEWSVVVTDERGWPLKMVIFRYLDDNDPSARTMILPADN